MSAVATTTTAPPTAAPDSATGPGTGGRISAARLTRPESLRGYGSLAVFLAHVYAQVQGFGTDRIGSRLTLGAGLMALFTFFALSGYLLYLPFARRDFAEGHGIDIVSYGRNRLLRILPLYFVVLVFLVIVNGSDARTTFRFLTLTGSFSEDLVAKAVDGPMWSLIVELHFYALLPLMALGLRWLARGSRRNAAAVLIAAGVVTAIVRYTGLGDREVYQYSLPGVFHYFVPGMLLALVRARDLEQLFARLPSWARRADVWVLAAIPFYSAVIVDLDAAPICTIACFLAVGACVLPLRTGIVDRILDIPPIQWMGVLSYSFYLLHVPILHWFGLPPDNGIGEVGRLFALSLPICLVAAYVAYRIVEKPALEMQRDWVMRPGARPWRLPVGWWRRWRAWIGVGALALATRAVTAAVTWPPPFGAGTPDATDYDRLGRALAEDGTFGASQLAAGGGPTAFRPPGYPTFLAGVYRATANSVSAARIAQVLLGVAAVLLVGALASRLWGRRIGLVAGLIAAVYPPLVAASTAPMSEALFLPLELAALVCAVEAGRRADWRWAAAAGAAGGLAVLTRPAGLVLVPVLVLLALPRQRRRLVAGTAALAALVVVTPWVVKASSSLDTFVPVSTIDGFNLAGTYNTETEDDPDNPGIFRPPAFVQEHAPLFADESLDEAELASELRDRGTSYAADHPGYVLEVVARSTWRLVDAAGADLTRDVYAVDYAIEQRRFADLAFASWWLLVPFAVAGIVIGALRRTPWALWLAPVLLGAVTVPVLGHARLRAPIEPFVVLLAAVAVDAGWRAWRARNAERAASRPSVP